VDQAVILGSARRRQYLFELRAWPQPERDQQLAAEEQLRQFTLDPGLAAEVQPSVRDAGMRRRAAAEVSASTTRAHSSRVAGYRRRASRRTADRVTESGAHATHMCSRTIGRARAIRSAGAQICDRKRRAGSTPASACQCEVIRPFDWTRVWVALPRSWTKAASTVSVRAGPSIPS
jgi:hypothetical protein